MLDMKMYPLPIKGMIEENCVKNRSNRYQVRGIARLDWSKMAKHLSVNSRGKFLSWHEVSRQLFLLGSYFSDVCCTFHLGKMFIRFLSINFYILLFTNFYSTTFVYHGRTFRRHVSFSIS